MSFDLNDYIDVPARIALMAAKFPESSLQSELSPQYNDSNQLVGWLCKAYAFRTPDDPRPGVGHAFEPVPGKTPYTKDSEVMNAETSAWGRAIVALGFETKKIASQNEVRARQENPVAQARAAQPAAQTAPSDGVLTDVITVAVVYGPNNYGFYDLKATDDRKFSTKDQDMVAWVADGDTAQVSWTETVKGKFTNRYLKTCDRLDVPVGAGFVDESEIPF